MPDKNSFPGADNLHIDHLHLTTRAYHGLRNLGIVTLSEIAKCSERDLLRQPNLGGKTINHIKEVLAEFELKLSDFNREVWP